MYNVLIFNTLLKTKWYLTKSNIRVLSILFCIYLGCSSIAFAQYRSNYGQANSIPQANNNVVEDTGPDSTIYKYVLIDDVYQTHEIEDTLSNITFLHRDPIYTSSNEHINLGNSGSASFPLLYRPTINIGFAPGYHQYDIYSITNKNFRFYEQNRPISDLYFSQLANQANLIVGAQFSRNFKNGLSFSINYNRISQNGFYTNQSTKTTNFGIGIRYKTKDERYNAFLVFLNNANNEINNGGIQSADDLSNRFKTAVPIILSDASTRHQEKQLLFVQYYKLSKNRDWNIYLKNKLEYNPSYYKYYDSVINDSSDSLFYGDLAIDSRGLRRYLSVNHVKNEFYLNGQKTENIYGKIGLSIDYFHINLNDSTSQRVDATLLFDGKIPIIKGLDLKTNTKIGVGKNAGNFDLKGNIDISLSKIAKLNGGIQLFRSEQAYNAQKLMLNDSLIFDNNFVKSIGSVLHGEISIPKLKFKIGLAQSIVNNPVFWGLGGLPEQKDGVLSTTYLSIKQNIKWWKINLDNQIHYQLFSDAIYPLPSLYSTHQLYFTGSLFKKVMQINYGLDLKLINNYSGGYYQPIFGTLHQSNTTLPFFPAANLFFLARVSNFRAAFIYENFSQSFYNDHNFDVHNYPLFEPNIRFTLSWLLKD